MKYKKIVMILEEKIIEHWKKGNFCSIKKFYEHKKNQDIVEEIRNTGIRIMPILIAEGLYKDWKKELKKMKN